MSLQGSPKPGPEVAPPAGFKEVAACPDEGFTLSSPIEATPETRPPKVMVEPMVATMYVSLIVQDEATGVMYMDTVTALVGRVALGNSHMVANLQRPTVEDVTDLT